MLERARYKPHHQEVEEGEDVSEDKWHTLTATYTPNHQVKEEEEKEEEDVPGNH
jgi:hypothetical protein